MTEIYKTEQMKYLIGSSLNIKALKIVDYRKNKIKGVVLDQYYEVYRVFRFSNKKWVNERLDKTLRRAYNFKEVYKAFQKEKYK